MRKIRSERKDFVQQPSEKNSHCFGKPSKTLARSNFRLPLSGDGDVWVEKIYRHKKTGEHKVFFCSLRTGKKLCDEPPTGASQVVYL